MELRHAILGLLSIQPLSGYDLGRAFAGTVAHFWYADQSQIYRTLDRLAADGAIETERIRQQTHPDRKVHTLTDRGRAELTAWLTSPLEPERPKEPFLARLFFAAELGVEGVERLLEERERQTREVLERLRAITVPAGDRAAVLQQATLSSGIAHAEAELEWLADTRRRNAGAVEQS
ncbi:transcriptional regulator, PadR-like family [Beutenbergia cavernae DSM 12333]|uniref:Transcriptional regulator, PadR-like family n=1 Tax=Beutenbergia cavernae (strain ATCC BAA-8 / DSM 12333 / CCUG 43141 / JCM 11478 / NBRC 16432 / NCIMB 13614 / HKI 0122) TaxID=471853 RepID=C5C3M5_BEUC1|nr:PadR family transcriptional regulator [Beutenbergia cavernae]ACQ81934.1 transcriptional regulator, PadR-like family [Beutenbergia cavernae DSM 12333]